MSHQDAYVKEDRLNADCLNEAFLWLFKGIDWSAIQFRIDCGWMPATFAAMALLFAWSSEQTLIDRFRSSLKIIAGEFRCQGEFRCLADPASFRVADDHDGAAHGRCRGDGK